MGASARCFVSPPGRGTDRIGPPKAFDEYFVTMAMLPKRQRPPNGPLKGAAEAVPKTGEGQKMTTTNLIVGLDGSPAGERALAFAKERAMALGDCTITVCYVVEWSPWTFQTPEENETRHARRTEETALARKRIVDPAMATLKADGVRVEDHVAHGDAAEVLNRVAKEKGAAQIVIGRVGAQNMIERVFGGVSGRLIASAIVPVTIVP